MQLTEMQSRKLLRTHGVYVTCACDRCGKILGAVRYTRRDEPGEWCSEVCRDGFERKAGVCQHCGTSLNGKRKQAKYCSDVCRKRQQVRDRANNPETPIADKGLNVTNPALWCHPTTPMSESLQTAPMANPRNRQPVGEPEGKIQ